MLRTSSSATTQRLPENVTDNIRIVSLLPGLTDIIHELGLSKYLVATSHECDTEIGTAITTPKLPITEDLSSREISAGWNMVSSQQSQSLTDIISNRICSFYSVNSQELLKSTPSLILTQIAKPRSFMDPDDDELRQFLHVHIPSLRTIVSASYKDLTEIYNLYHSLAHVTNREDEAVQLVASARTTLNMINRHSQQILKEKHRRGSRVAVIQWTDPLFIAGDWIPQIISIAGGVCGVTVTGGPSVPISVDTLTEMDLLVFAVCAVGIKGCYKIIDDFWRDHADELRNWSGRVIVTDATKLFSRPALETVIESTQVLADAILDLNVYGHRGELWEQWVPISSFR